MSNEKQMRAYSIEDLLIGQTYISPNDFLKRGEIVSAEKRPEVWSNENEECYLIGYYSKNSIHRQYATIAVNWN
jgi:hypothetical protein